MIAGRYHDGCIIAGYGAVQRTGRPLTDQCEACGHLLIVHGYADDTAHNAGSTCAICTLIETSQRFTFRNTRRTVAADGWPACHQLWPDYDDGPQGRWKHCCRAAGHSGICSDQLLEVDDCGDEQLAAQARRQLGTDPAIRHTGQCHAKFTTDPGDVRQCALETGHIGWHIDAYSRTWAP